MSTSIISYNRKSDFGVNTTKKRKIISFFSRAKKMRPQTNTPDFVKLLLQKADDYSKELASVKLIPISEEKVLPILVNNNILPQLLKTVREKNNNVTRIITTVRPSPSAVFINVSLRDKPFRTTKRGLEDRNKNRSENEKKIKDLFLDYQGVEFSFVWCTVDSYYNCRILI